MMNKSEIDALQDAQKGLEELRDRLLKEGPNVGEVIFEEIDRLIQLLIDKISK